MEETWQRQGTTRDCLRPGYGLRIAILMNNYVAHDSSLFIIFHKTIAPRNEAPNSKGNYDLKICCPPSVHM